MRQGKLTDDRPAQCAKGHLGQTQRLKSARKTVPRLSSSHQSDLEEKHERKKMHSSFLRDHPDKASSCLEAAPASSCSLAGRKPPNLSTGSFPSQPGPHREDLEREQEIKLEVEGSLVDLCLAGSSTKYNRPGGLEAQQGDLRDRGTSTDAWRTGPAEQRSLGDPVDLRCHSSDGGNCVKENFERSVQMQESTVTLRILINSPCG